MGDPVTVEIILRDLMVSGVTTVIDERYRLVDVLNRQEHVFRLTAAQLFDRSGNRFALVKEFAVEKGDILVALPRETDEYRRQQRMARAGMTRPASSETSLVAALPPLVVKGVVNIQSGLTVQRGREALVNRFVALRNASIQLAPGSVIEAEVAVVNRDQIAGLAELPQGELDRYQGESIALPA